MSDYETQLGRERAAQLAKLDQINQLTTENAELRAKLDFEFHNAAGLNSLCNFANKQLDECKSKLEQAEKDIYVKQCSIEYAANLAKEDRARVEQSEAKCAEMRALEKERDEMWDLLKKLEWIEYNLDALPCTACGGMWPNHKPECIYVRKREAK